MQVTRRFRLSVTVHFQHELVIALASDGARRRCSLIWCNVRLRGKQLLVACCRPISSPPCPMEPNALRAADTQAGHSRFGESRAGESRFGPSRFGQSRFGVWVEEGKPDAQGRITGLYRTPGTSGDGGAAVTALTVVRPPAALETATAAKAKAVATPAAPRALHLPGGRAGVLLFHGLTSTPLELQFLARGLHRAGYTVRVAVIDGYTHGLKPSAGLSHADWASAAVAEFDRMRPSCDTLAVGGLCIGSLLALHVAAQRPSAASHVLALSTALKYDGWAAPRTRWLLPLVPWIPGLGRIAVKEREPYGVKDERLRAWIGAQMKESGGSDAGAASLKVKDLFESLCLMKLVRAGMAQILAPTLLIHARDDEAASPKNALEVAKSVSSRRVHFVLLNDSYHMISIDREKTRVLNEMKDFLHGTPSPEPVSVPVAAPAPAPAPGPGH